MTKQTIFMALAMGALIGTHAAAANGNPARPERAQASSGLHTALPARFGSPELPQGVLMHSAGQNTLSERTPYELPYSETMRDAARIEADFTMLDLDNDGVEYGESNVKHRWFYKPDEMLIQYCNDLDDPHKPNDWLIFPPIHLDGTTMYRLMIVANAGAESTLRLTVGTSTDPATHTTIGELNGLHHGWLDVYNTEFAVESDNVYYLGIYNASSESSFYINVAEIGITAAGSAFITKAPANFTAIPGDKGAIKATVSFDAPAASVNGSPIQSEVTTLLYRNDELAETFVTAPGAHVTWSDPNPASGYNTYRAVGVNDFGEGQSSTQRIWVGPDVTVTPTLKTVRTTDRNMNVYMAWDPVDTPAHEGAHFDPSEVTYNIYRGFNRNEMTIIAEGVTDTCYTDTEIKTLLNGEQEGFFYGISTVTSGGEVLSSARIIAVGEPYRLPQQESFPGRAFQIKPWLTESVSGSFSWELIGSDNTLGESQDADGGMCKFDPSYGGDIDSRLVSPVFTLDGASHPTLSFWMYQWASWVISDASAYLMPEIRLDCGEWIPLCDWISCASENYGWQEYSFDLSEYAGASTIQLGFRGRSDNWLYFYMDNIHVEARPDHDLALTNFYGTTSANIESAGQYVVEAYNRGQLPASDFAFELLFDGEVTARHQSSEPLAPGQRTSVTLSHYFNATMDGEHIMSARVVFGSDENQLDNESQPLTVKVRPSFFPVPESLAGTADSEAVTLTWNAPTLPPYDETVVDGAEDYESWLTYDFGDWICHDGDGKGSGRVIDIPAWPNSETNQAFIVWAPLEIDPTMGDYYPEMLPYSGDKCFVSWYANVSDFTEEPRNDDYLISPEVLPGTHLSFMVKGLSSIEYDETYEVMYSSTDRNPESFTALESSVASAVWEKVDIDLPADARYFCIHYTGESQLGLMVDDIKYTPITCALKILGYNVYRFGEQINDELVTTNTFIDRNPHEGANFYNVAAIFDRGSSLPGNTVRVVYSKNSIEDIDAEGAAKVSSRRGMVSISTAEPTAVTIHTPAGQCVYSATISGKTDISLPTGIYIVSAGATIAKVAL